ncbi:MAG: DUF1343 domain-containing protein [Sedimentisphaerales bacterium]|nr:DUF1343 domain-containing protein [Sedimentisphaerales bacterium]
MTELKYPFIILLLLLIGGEGCRQRPSGPGPKDVVSETGLGYQPFVDGKIENAVQEEIAKGNCAGAVVLVGRDDEIVYWKALGQEIIIPHREEMTKTSVFDLASVSKPVGTATSIMILLDRKQIDLDDYVGKFLPAFACEGKEKVQIFHLLTHTSGLAAYTDAKAIEKEHGSVCPEMVIAKICSLKALNAPGEKFRYSCLNYITLGKIVEVISGKKLDEFAAQNIFKPLGMKHTGYNPPQTWRNDIAATEVVEGKPYRGVVHDPLARLMAGVSGNAGVFSDAYDLSIYCRMLLNHGTYKNVKILSANAVNLLTAAQIPGHSCGFHISSNMYASDPAFAHKGYTGTYLLCDPIKNIFIILLANRVHPEDKGTINPLRDRITEIVFRELSVQTGLDKISAYANLFRGKRVGIITNHTAYTRSGKHIAQVFADMKDTKVTALFGPEHGIYGLAEDAIHIEDQKDPLLGVPIYSLYGKHLKPTAEMLKNVDVLVFDIQDIGARFYTYVYTMSLAMEAAAEMGKEFVVLDRPNPLNGVNVEGNILEPEYSTFVGLYPIPVRHGMTVGELARMFNSQGWLKNGIKAKLTVVPMKGWKRELWYKQTGLDFIKTSPNMPDLETATIYPGLCLLEGTNLSEGRGTSSPFLQFGAPWINAEELTANLNALALPGVKFGPASFTPTMSKHQNVECFGCRIDVTDRNLLEPYWSGIQIVNAIYQMYPKKFEWKTRHFDRLCGSSEIRQAIVNQTSLEELKRKRQSDLASFLEIRKKYLLY